jgi:CHAD domain-containing protein
MTYRLRQDETEDYGLRRCAGEELDRAVAELTDGIESDPVTAVHDARKSLKKTRALLRLGTGTLDPDERRAVNAALRDAGRQLSAARDAEVMIEAVDDLAERYAGQLPKPVFDAVRARLEAEAATARGSLAAAGEVADELKRLRARVDGWQMRRTGWPAVGDGLRRSYARGRRAFRRARRQPSTENLHEWRKRGKDLWYHLRALEPISASTMAGHAEEAHRLSDLLGDDHDLAVLRESLLTDAATAPTDLDSVIRLIDHRRRQLQVQALSVGARLYAEKPKAFVRRLRAYWRAWRTELPAEPPVELPGRVPTPTGST